jgi:hypothetical protein
MTHDHPPHDDHPQHEPSTVRGDIDTGTIEGKGIAVGHGAQATHQEGSATSQANSGQQTGTNYGTINQHNYYDAPSSGASPPDEARSKTHAEEGKGEGDKIPKDRTFELILMGLTVLVALGAWLAPQEPWQIPTEEPTATVESRAELMTTEISLAEAVPSAEPTDTPEPTATAEASAEPTDTPEPTATAEASAEPCAGRISPQNGTHISVRDAARANSGMSSLIDANEAIIVIDGSTDVSGTRWYKVANPSGISLGWVRSVDVMDLGDCQFREVQ